MPKTIEFKGSSNVKSATMNDDGTCEVSFSNGSRATYKNVGAALFKEWEEAESAGRFFHAKIRSKPTEFPMIASHKEPPAHKDPEAAEHAAATATPTPAPTPAPTAADGALAAAQSTVAGLRAELAAAHARADKAELELAAHKTRARVQPQGSADFRPWRRR